MKSFFSGKALLLLLLTISLCVSLAIVGCGKPPPDTNSETTYTITFDSGAEGLDVAPLTAKAGDELTEPVLQREGYRFGGWTLDGEPYVLNIMPEENLTLSASWIKLNSVTFITGTDETIPTAWYAPGETVKAASPSREGYKFMGWKLNGTPYDLGKMPEENLTLSAIWEPLISIKFNTGAKDFSIEPITDIAGAQIKAPAVTRFGYYLEYWTLNGIRYEFNVMPGHSITLEAKWVKLTNLPAMFIDLADNSGKTVPLTSVTREAYVNSTITLTNTDEKYKLDSLQASFKGRGHGSWNEQKKCYKIKFDKKQSLFGRAKNKHWVLVACANFDDVTMSRNYLAYNMANEVFDNLEYSTPAYWIDMYVNGEYRGVYLLCEHVRVGDGRVDITSEYGILDTGYLLEYDSYAAEGGAVEGVDYFRIDGVKYPFTVHSPDPEEYATDGNISKQAYMAQVAYIKDYVSKVYNAAYSQDFDTFAELADVNSFVDMYILHELFKNVDTGWSSFYLYKKAGGKLYSGPVWDFDGTTNTAYDRGDRTPQGIYVAGAGEVPYNYASELFINLYKSSGFRNAVKERWQVLSPKIRSFLDERLNDEVYEAYCNAMGKNFALWKHKDQTVAETDWVTDVKALKQWLVSRVAWLDMPWKV